MRYLIIIACLLTPSFGFAHMSTFELEADCHGIDWIWAQSGLGWKNPVNGYEGVSWMDDQRFYYQGNWCCGGNCDHDVVRDPSQSCRNPPDILYFTGHSGWYVLDGKPSGLKADINIIDGVKHYHLYRQNYEYYINSSGVLDMRDLSQTVLSNLRIDKYVSQYNYQFYKSWMSDFTFDEYVAAIGSDKYYIRADITDIPYCNYGFYIETFFVVPLCVTKDYWQLKLCRRQDNGSLWCASQSNILWKFYGRPSFSEVSSVFIKDLSQGQLAKSDFIQDETIYESNGQTYQGFSYWYAVATYNGNAYVFRMYGSDPPCSGVFSDGQGKLDTGKGSMFGGSGFRSTAAGGYEEPKH